MRNAGRHGLGARLVRKLRGGAAALTGACAALCAAADELPDFAALEAQGATIGAVHVRPLPIFDETDPREDNALFRLANRLHLTTHPGVVQRWLLFRSGEPLRVRTIDESERLLRAQRFFHDVQIRPVALRDGVVDIEVATRDTWTLEPGLSAARSGGVTTSGFGLRDYNLLGTGVAVGLERSNGVDRTSTAFDLSAPQLFGSHVALDFAVVSRSDGHSSALSVDRPFHALDARWAAGASTSRDDRIERIYVAGERVGGYRRRSQRAELYGGLSEGLVDGWVQRRSVGLAFVDDQFQAEPGVAPPDRLPADRRLAAPFLRWQWIEDRVDRERNRNLIGRPEYFALGLQATVQLGASARALGASIGGARLAASVAHGFAPFGTDTLIAAAQLSSEPRPQARSLRRIGVAAQYYAPISPRRLLYAAIAADAVAGHDPADALLLGGDSGLRGYPLRYQAGARRVLATVEQRFYTDLYVWRLFRVGAAMFADVGRASRGPTANRTDPGWLGDVGAGLRIVNARVAFASVLHVDVATPVAPRGDIRRWQLLVKAKATF